jgi:hypothetical protein
MAVCTSGLEGLHFPSLSCIAPVGVTSVALGVRKRFSRFFQTTWLSCNFPLTVSRKESGYEMRFYHKDSLKSNMNMCEWGAFFNVAYSIESIQVRRV